ncbi:hypothetical protein MMC25_000838 [Agyrium rufum]|nr:hypothetical protein [Agyrium rufum]
MATQPNHPDSKLHPEATGLAKKIVDEHQKPESLVLYSGWFCPLVPTLEYDKKPLYESNVICEFLEEVYPDNKLHLQPTDPYQRAISRIWTDFVTSRVIPSFHRFLQHQPDQSSHPITKLREEFHGHLLEFANAMDPEGPYFFGKEPKLVDLTMAPFAMRLWVFDHYKEGGFGAPEGGQGGDKEKSWARWRQWISAIENRQSVKETTSERQYYLSIYQKYADNVAQSELAKATREGKGVP